MTSGAGSMAASIALALSIVLTLGVATTSAAQAGEASHEGDAPEGHCIVIDPNGPGVLVDPQSCKDIVTGGLSASPWAAAP